jgi:hypothetical protein
MVKIDNFKYNVNSQNTKQKTYICGHLKNGQKSGLMKKFHN